MSLLVVKRGDTTFRFDMNAGAALVYLSYDGSPNLINSIGDYGREFQACLWEGFNSDPKFPSFWDIINPTQAGTAYPRTGSEVIRFSEQEPSGDEPFVLEVDVDPLDYTPKDRKGGYRQTALANRWPRTGWDLNVKYSMVDRYVELVGTFSHSDAEYRMVQSASITAHLEPHFIGPFVNDNERNVYSWCREAFGGRKVIIDSPSTGLRVTYRTLEGNTTKGRTWDLDRDGDYSTVRDAGCSKYVNPPDHEASDLVVLQTDAEEGRWVKAGEKLIVSACLEITDIPLHVYYIPLRNVDGLYRSYMSAIATTDTMYRLELFKNGQTKPISVFSGMLLDTQHHIFENELKQGDVARLSVTRPLGSLVVTWQDLNTKRIAVMQKE